MPVRTARKLGFWTACALLFGSVVGIGIFVKNGGVLRATSGDGLTTLLAWIVGGLISLFAAISFSEIGSQRTVNVHGLSAWAEKGLGKRFGYFTRFNFAVFYQAILVTVISFFVSEIFFTIIRMQARAADGNDPLKVLFSADTVWIHVVVALVVTSIYVSLNLVSVYASGIFSTVATVLKIVPLVIAVVVGIALVTTNNEYISYGGLGSKTTGFNNLAVGPNFTFTGMLAALPAVLFSYDAFLNVGTLSSKTRGGAKTVSKSVLFTMIAIVILYTAISISQNLHNAAWIHDLLFSVLPTSSATVLGIIVWIFILISALGVTNGISASLVANMQQAVATNTFFGSKTLKRKYGTKNAVLITIFAIMSFWALVIFIPTLVFKADNIVDAYSNYPTTFFFAIYGFTIIAYWVKRKQSSSQKINSALFYIASSLAVAGLLFTSFYQLFYGFTIRAWIEPDISSSTGFFASAPTFNILQEFGVFASAFALFFILPFVNLLIAKRFENNKVVIETQSTILEDELTAESEFESFGKAYEEEPAISTSPAAPAPKARQAKSPRRGSS